MVSSRNRRELENRLRDAIESDKAHSEITSISKFGIIEMTRERMRPAYFETVNKKCEVCDGLGIVRNDEMIAISAFREILTIASKGGLRGVTCRLPVESMNYLVNSKLEDLRNTEKEYGVKITVLADLKLIGRYVMETEKTESEVKVREHEKSAEGHPHKYKGREREKTRDEAGGRAASEAGEKVHPGAGTGAAETEATGKGEVTSAEEQKGQEAGPHKRKPRDRYRRRGRSRRPRKDVSAREDAAGGTEDKTEHAPETGEGGHSGATDW
jgi:ribonuclease E